MNTLVCSQKSPLYLANFSPWKPMAPSIIPTSIQKTLNNPPSTWKAQANAKGFGSTPPSVQETSIKKTSSDADDEKIPEEVMYRIIKRVLASVGAPMALSFASMQLIGLIMEQHIWNVPKWFMFLTLFLTLGASVCGIAYGALSTSMDPNEKGSFLGFEQIQKNWVEMWREEDEGKKSWD
ncbi:PROTEIN PAM68 CHLOROPLASTIC [Salix koriyanagi]|uniref:PROTEIN PAM68 CHLOROPLASTIC n=1 Tax=Salix koriyanagi TaxID=2511006 RepID=A0A9Q0ZL07_9ROSI|nr:PROTEIN PAM68 CHLOROPLASTIC [Salix koriyanagi]